MNSASQSFIETQKTFPRVKDAFKEKEADAKKLLSDAHLSGTSFDMYIRVFKEEEILEVWGSKKGENNFVLLTSIPVCSMSGGPGPKRKEGDRQVPEGFYHINHFNPQSNFLLSLGIDYPNTSDRFCSDKQHPGGAIYIHGNCVSIGCVAIRDDNIRLVYVLAVKARESGQEPIPVHIFPCRMKDETYLQLIHKHEDESSLISFWKDILPGYQYFEETHRIPVVRFINNGMHKISKIAVE